MALKIYCSNLLCICRYTILESIYDPIFLTNLFFLSGSSFCNAKFRVVSNKNTADDEQHTEDMHQSDRFT